VRNKHHSLEEGGQTAYATVNSGRNEGSAGLNVPGFESKGMILHCKMILSEACGSLGFEKGGQGESTSRVRRVSLVGTKGLAERGG
jgi:hypothetical protein